MKLTAGCACAVVMLAVACPSSVSAQGPPALAQGRAQPRFSVEGAAGPQIDYKGDMQSVAIGFAPTRSLTLLVGAERSHIKDESTTYTDGFSYQRGGTTRFLSAGIRYAFFSSKRVSPYGVVGWGVGRFRQNVSAEFPETETQGVSVFFFGPGVRFAVRRQLDVFVDGRLTTQMITTGPNRAETGIWMPLRIGAAWRF